MRCRERALDSMSVRIPQPYNKYTCKGREGENSRDKKGASSLGEWKSIGPSLKILQSHTIKYTQDYQDHSLEGN